MSCFGLAKLGRNVFQKQTVPMKLTYEDVGLHECI